MTLAEAILKDIEIWLASEWDMGPMTIVLKDKTIVLTKEVTLVNPNLETR